MARATLSLLSRSVTSRASSSLMTYALCSSILNSIHLRPFTESTAQKNYVSVHINHFWHSSTTSHSSLASHTWERLVRICVAQTHKTLDHFTDLSSLSVKNVTQPHAWVGDLWMQINVQTSLWILVKYLPYASKVCEDFCCKASSLFSGRNV